MLNKPFMPDYFVKLLGFSHRQDFQFTSCTVFHPFWLALAECIVFCSSLWKSAFQG